MYNVLPIVLPVTITANVHHVQEPIEKELLVLVKKDGGVMTIYLIVTNVNLTAVVVLMEPAVQPVKEPKER